MRVRQVGALMLGILLFCYPAYVIISDWLEVRRRFPENASSALATIAMLGTLYGAVVISVALRWRQARRLTGREAFSAGLRGAGVLFVVGFFGPFVYAWVTRTDVGNIAPIMGVLGLIVGAVIAAGVGLIVFATAPARD